MPPYPRLREVPPPPKGHPRGGQKKNSRKDRSTKKPIQPSDTLSQPGMPVRRGRSPQEHAILKNSSAALLVTCFHDGKNRQKYCISSSGYPSSRSKSTIMADPSHFHRKPDHIFPDQEPPLFFDRIALPGIGEIPDNL
jgi:hypothetical protein